MIALNQKDLHVHSPFCPHRASDAPLEEYLTAAEKQGIVELGFAEHGPFPAPLSLTQYTKHPTLTDEEVELYFREMYALRETYTGPVKITIGLEVDFLEGFEEETARSLDLYGPRMEDGLLSVHNLLVDGRYLNLGYQHNIIAAVGKMGARKLSELYYRTMLKLVITDLGPYKPKRVGHPTMLALCGKHFPEFNEERALMEEFVAAAKEYGFALELNTAGLESPEDCEEIYGQALLPYMKKYDVPVSLGADAHRPERIGSDFDHPVILEAMKYLRPVWGDGTLRAAHATGTARYEEAANDCIG